MKISGGARWTSLKILCQNVGERLFGGIIALIIACTGVYRLIIGIILVGMGIWAGNYFQYNKDAVKDKLRKFIDKM